MNLFGYHEENTHLYKQVLHIQHGQTEWKILQYSSFSWYVGNGFKQHIFSPDA